tara:strand:+ start:946 stop:1086 length:141 start_codon:yes stop_codon:yes gene_type:complete
VNYETAELAFRDDGGDSLLHCLKEDVSWELLEEKIAEFIKALGFEP